MTILNESIGLEINIQCHQACISATCICNNELRQQNLREVFYWFSGENVYVMYELGIETMGDDLATTYPITQYISTEWGFLGSRST